MRVLLAIALGFCCSRSVDAQTIDAVVPSLEFAVTGGTWAQGGVRGQYRVLVFSGGFEHIVSEVYIQWIRDPESSSDTAALVRSVPARQANHFWRVNGPPVVQRRPGGATVTVRLVDPHDSQPAQICVFTVGTPGEYAGSCRTG